MIFLTGCSNSTAYNRNDGIIKTKEAIPFVFNIIDRAFFSGRDTQNFITNMFLFDLIKYAEQNAFKAQDLAAKNILNKLSKRFLSDNGISFSRKLIELKLTNNEGIALLKYFPGESGIINCAVKRLEKMGPVDFGLHSVINTIDDYIEIGKYLYGELFLTFYTYEEFGNGISREDFNFLKNKFSK